MSSTGTLDGLPVIVGAGIAGLMTALNLDQPVVVVSQCALGQGTSSGWAQGGIAASVGAQDTPALHLADTLKAGDGLCDAAAAARIVETGRGTIDSLARYGVQFDRDDTGALLRGLEAAHGQHRIVHAAGDATGAEIMRALIDAVRAKPSIIVLEQCQARALNVEDNRICGLHLHEVNGPHTVITGRVVLATGGLGGLFLESTNPVENFGQGLMLAAQAGAQLADLEFVQFHPTALDSAASPMKLVSEAVRGAGALLLNDLGQRFMADVPDAELAPRDSVARAVWAQIRQGRRVFLDARTVLGQDFARRFPSIHALCLNAGIDPAVELIPVRPAAHYHMGGIQVDEHGRSSVEGLWACGEVACTGLHGANRLASNSLLEAASCAANVARDVADKISNVISTRSIPDFLGPKPDATLVRPIMSRHVGLIRDKDGLSAAISDLLPLASRVCPAQGPASLGLMIAMAALQREESRGAHFRTDFPLHSATAKRSLLRLDDVLQLSRAFESLDTYSLRRA